MEVWQAAVLGLIQGLTEFLPVSSSGHIAFFQGVFGINDGEIALFFTIILHLGTLVAVCAVFWRDIIELFKKPYKTLFLLIVATVPAGIVGLLFKIFDLDKVFFGANTYIFLAVFFLITSAELFITEIVANKKECRLPLGLKTTLPMGLLQAVAVLPGISRSGSTVFAGTLAGLDREESAKFSFLMSIPIILGSFIVELTSGLAGGEIQRSFLDGGKTLGLCVAIGFIISAIAGLFAIKIMYKAIKNANYKWFSLYLLLLSATCIILHFTYFN